MGRATAGVYIIVISAPGTFLLRFHSYLHLIWLTPCRSAVGDRLRLTIHFNGMLDIVPELLVHIVFVVPVLISIAFVILERIRHDAWREGDEDRAHVSQDGRAQVID